MKDLHSLSLYKHNLLGSAGQFNLERSSSTHEGSGPQCISSPITVQEYFSSGAQTSISVGTTGSTLVRNRSPNGNNNYAILAETDMKSAYCGRGLEEFDWQFETTLTAFRSMELTATLPQDDWATKKCLDLFSD